MTALSWWPERCAAGILSEAGEKIITREDVKLFREAGADVILMPAPGRSRNYHGVYPGAGLLCSHELGVLTLTAIGNLPGGLRSGYHPGDCADVQDDGNGYVITWETPDTAAWHCLKISWNMER